VKVLIATCAHRGDDARIVHRQAATLIGRGHEVLLVAPLPDAESLRLDPPKLERVAVKRSSGRRRVLSWIEVRQSFDDDFIGSTSCLFTTPNSCR
jgi:hypothetical protein